MEPQLAKNDWVPFQVVVHELSRCRRAGIDISQWVKWFAYDTVSHMAFGQNIGFVEQGKDVEGLIQAFHDMAPMAGLVAALPHIVNPLLESWLTDWYFMPTPGDGSGTGKIMQYRDNMLKNRLAHRHAKSHGDFLDNIMNAKNTDDGYMSTEGIKVEALVLMVAASDTSAAFIGPFINNIIQNKHIYSRLRQEIQQFESSGQLAAGVVTYEQTQNLPYFIACIKESLRYSPSIPFIMPRVVSKGGIEINGVYVPEGTEIGANPYVVHRNKEVFGEDAFIFNPDRWLEIEERTREMDKYILSWGYGPRICLGKNIAQTMTQKLCLEIPVAGIGIEACLGDILGNAALMGLTGSSSLFWISIHALDQEFWVDGYLK
ncbi:hypothetical protein ASPWEDRAFT_741538 [Aspergillus wentii DTO 134E9]|uniref:Cytochrome P450 n=1 Tax=Aspergillus wentii DTO 134E9 TaxID=1073089 RepID=A0A1L9RFC4_ASPWE|nr:uncharacterized protein ASPWEDRAFT_741538 [Aspergillus wentii DTO 134E9]OJJ33631.1 hypothetical protein ASPWEDRAFT_741538 [Aspergillus wentii DTO 134E9]